MKMKKIVFILVSFFVVVNTAYGMIITKERFAEHKKYFENAFVKEKESLEKQLDSKRDMKENFSIARVNKYHYKASAINTIIIKAKGKDQSKIIDDNYQNFSKKIEHFLLKKIDDLKGIKSKKIIKTEKLINTIETIFDKEWFDDFAESKIEAQAKKRNSLEFSFNESLKSAKKYLKTLKKFKKEEERKKIFFKEESDDEDSDSEEDTFGKIDGWQLF